jgi:hypothetical protein
VAQARVIPPALLEANPPAALRVMPPVGPLRPQS